jgi:microcystin-dependent protein
MPTHTHTLSGSTNNGVNVPTNNSVLARSNPQQVYAPPGSLVTMDANAVTSVGGSQPHLNMQPYLTLNFCIALLGIFPSRN